MTKFIDFYFDVISPYSYIAHKKIKDNYKNKKNLFKYKPILLGGLHKLANISVPAFNKFKLNYMRKDCELISKKHNINFQWNENFPINSIHIMRGYLLIQEDLKEKFIDKFFEAYWRDNKNLDLDSTFSNVINSLNIDLDFYFKGIQNVEIKEELKSLTSQAFDKEIFGAPTFVVNEKLFWGQDRLEYAIEELENF